MRRSALFVMAVIGVCLAFGSSPPSAQRGARVPVTGRAPAAAAGAGGIGGGVVPGGRGYTVPVQFQGLTTRKFPLGAGTLTLSRACNEEHPISRLCEWGDIFRAFPPITLETEALVAANYDTRPAPMCLTPEGATRCSQGILMRPAACCGYPPPPPPATFLLLSPSDPQTLTDCANTFQFTVTAEDANNAPLKGVYVTFEFVWFGNEDSVSGIFNPFSGLTDANGEFTTTLTMNQDLCTSFCADPLKNCATEIEARDVTSATTSNIVSILDGIP